MDEMYRTVQAACSCAIRAHNREKRIHVIFKEMGLYRIKPVDEIREINQKAIFGWTVPKWLDIHQNMPWGEVRQQFPMGDDSFIRKQFTKDGYYKPSVLHYKPRVELKLYNEYSKDEITDCIMNGQRL